MCLLLLIIITFTSSAPIDEDKIEETVTKTVIKKVFNEIHFMEKIGYFDDMNEKGGLDYNAPKEHNGTVNLE